MSLAFYHPTGGFFERVHPVSKLISLAAAFVPPFFGTEPVEVLPYLALLFLAALFFWPEQGRILSASIN